MKQLTKEHGELLATELAKANYQGAGAPSRILFQFRDLGYELSGENLGKTLNDFIATQNGKGNYLSLVNNYASKLPTDVNKLTVEDTELMHIYDELCESTGLLREEEPSELSPTLNYALASTKDEYVLVMPIMGPYEPLEGLSTLQSHELKVQDILESYFGNVRPYMYQQYRGAAFSTEEKITADQVSELTDLIHEGTKKYKPASVRAVPTSIQIFTDKYICQ